MHSRILVYIYDTLWRRRTVLKCAVNSLEDFENVVSEIRSRICDDGNYKNNLCSLINGCTMKRFKTFLKEAQRRHPLWVCTITAGLVLKIQRLETEIALTDDLVKQNRLLAQISKLLSYMSGLSIGTSSTNLQIPNKI